MINAFLDAETIDLAPYIDHALLLPTTTAEQVAHGCSEADRYSFAAVCVYPVHVRQAAELLRNRPVKVCSVIGFPTGATTSAAKLYEAQEAVENGASELDVVINLGWLKAGQHNEVHQELAVLCEETGLTVKAILEASLLTPPELELACEICMDAGVAFLKTSTGWQGGATVEAVQQMRELTKGRVGIKASGGIRTVDQAVRLIQAGATRLGTSRGPDLIHQQQAKA
ncbi:MAG: deoxyribose-phosphate aldolase [Cyanobacteria bacterium Co-bin13]|nr:deoxyribose-phosphate aldolase [Cyanobacteria bacterium Co-bin13]